MTDGFITTTRGEGKDVRPIDLTAPERETAHRRQRDYFERLLRETG